MNKLILILIVSFSFTQWFNINHGGVNRTYYVSYPNNASQETPLIINMHGYGGNAINQQIYSDMDQFAHSENVTVVYPQGLNYSWNVFTYWDSNPYDDVGFISAMINDISENFNIDLDRVYACGMSNGGYMSYRLACDLSDKIAAFGSVTGNFMINNSINDCQDQNRDIPIIHFHGTEDGVVNYYPPSFDGALTIDESIQFWSDYNDLNQNSVETINNNVEIYRYYNEASEVDFVHYKIYGGGHDWFGSSWVTDWGFNASQELVDFFLQYRLSDFITSYLPGDLNEDNLINIQDVIIVINLILDSEFNLAADINSDSTVDVLDVIQLVNIILN
jgi:polyhydroxybutyrate depolymerase